MSPRVLAVRERVSVRSSLRVNDTSHDLSVDSRLTLLDALRDVLGLTGTKKGVRSGRMRRLYRHHRRPACLVLSHAGGGVRRPARRDD